MRNALKEIPSFTLLENETHAINFFRYSYRWEMFRNKIILPNDVVTQKTLTSRCCTTDPTMILTHSNTYRIEDVENWGVCNLFKIYICVRKISYVFINVLVQRVRMRRTSWRVNSKWNEIFPLVDIISHPIGSTYYLVSSIPWCCYCSTIFRFVNLQLAVTWFSSILEQRHEYKFPIIYVSSSVFSV